MRLLLLGMALLPGLLWAQTEDGRSAPVDPGAEPLIHEDAPELEDDFSSLSWRLGGNLQYDGLLSSDAPEARQDRAELRRARLSASAEWGFNWRGRVAADFADGAALRDLSVEFLGARVYLEFGRFIEPFSLLQASARGAAFMERPLALGIAPGYGLGFSFNLKGPRWGLTGGAFNSTKNDPFFGGREEDAFTLRYTAAPWRGADGLLHLGASASARSSAEGFIQFVAIPESILLKDSNVSSARLVGADYALLGAEAALLHGPLLLSAELLQVDISETIPVAFDEQGNFFFAVEPRPFRGGYVEAAWALSGERRDYSVRRGSFSGLYPRGRLGALELSVRHSQLDLETPGVGGERGSSSAIGLNWYPGRNLKLMLSALRLEQESERNGREQIEAVQARVQYSFDLSLDALPGLTY